MIEISLSDAIHAAVQTGEKNFNDCLIKAALDAALRDASEITVEDTVEINRTLEAFINSIISGLSSGMRRVSVMKMDSYKEVMNLKSGKFDLDFNRLPRIPRGVCQALVEAGYKPFGLAKFSLHYDSFDPRQVTWVQDEFGNTNFSAPPLREFKEIELFVEFACH